MEFTRDIAKEVRTSIVDVVQEFLNVNYPDISITKSTAGYNGDTLDVKLQLFSSVNGETQAEADYKKYANLYDLPLEMLGARFNFGGTMFTVKGFKPKARKNDIIIAKDNGGEFVASHQSVKMAYKMHTSRDLGNLMPQETV
jgi:hypothetical protein